MNPLLGALWVAFSQFLGLVFLLAGFVKILRPRDTLASIDAYNLLPPWGSKLAARGLPWIEFAVAGSLVCSLFVQLGIALGLVLLVVFTWIHIWLLANGQVVPCGCFGCRGHGPCNIASVWSRRRRGRVLPDV